MTEHKHILSLLGIDFTILLQCSVKEQNKYVFVSRVVAFNVLLATFGIIYLFHLLFNNLAIAIVVGLMWGLILLNLKRFVFHSVSGKSMTLGVFISILLKLMVFAFFAVITAFPLQLIICNKSVNEFVSEFKESKRKEISEEIDLISKSERFLLNKKISELETDLKQKRDLIDNQKLKLAETTDAILRAEITHTIEVLTAEYEKRQTVSNGLIGDYKAQLTKLDSKKEHELEYYNQIIAVSNFVVQRGEFLFMSKPYFTRIFFLLFVCLFWYPLLFKQRATHRWEYDKIKRKIEFEMIKTEFDAFKENYEKNFAEKFGVKRSYPNKYYLNE